MHVGLPGGDHLGVAPANLADHLPAAGRRVESELAADKLAEHAEVVPLWPGPSLVWSEEEEDELVLRRVEHLERADPEERGRDARDDRPRLRPILSEDLELRQKDKRERARGRKRAGREGGRVLRGKELADRRAQDSEPIGVA